MRMCMAYNLKTELVEAFEHILTVEWDFLDSSIAEDDFVFLLWYAYLFNLDEKLLDRATDSKKWFLESSKELSIYFYLFDCLNQTTMPTTKEYQQRKNMLLEGNVLTDSEKKDIIAVLDLAFQPHLSTQKSNRIYGGSLVIINQSQIELVIQKYDLIYKNVEIPLYKSKNRGTPVSAYTNKTVLISPNHRKAFITTNKFKKFTSDKFPLIPKSRKYQQSSKEKNVKNITRNTSFKWPETELQEVKTVEKKEDNLKENSELRLMGYQITGLTRDERWRILKRAVPSLGLRKVATIIAYNVKLRKGQRNGLTKYRNAITEWEHDLAKLKQVYYRKEFKWSNT